MSSGNEYPAALAIGTSLLNSASPGNLPDALRSLAMSDGSTQSFATVLNQLIADANALKALAGGPVAASQTVTIGGTFAAGAVITVTIGGTAVSYTVVSGDSTNAGAATSAAAAINAATSVNTLVKASASSGVITITALVAGTGFNGTTLASSATSTMTATAGGPTFTGGVGPIQQPVIASGTGGVV